MITAIAASGNTIDTKLDSRFGRCPYFAIYDDKTKQTIFIANDFKDEQGGVGPMVVNKLAEMNVEKVIAAEFGPKAKDVLDALKIQMIILTDTNKTIDEIIKMMAS